MTQRAALRAMRAPATLLNRQCLGLTVHTTSTFSRPPLFAAGYASSRNETLSSKAATSLAYSALNPPASTLPAPLELPIRDRDASTFSHLLQTGKAYLKFYKTGLKAVFTNRGILRETIEEKAGNDQPSVMRPGVVPPSFTRADWVLMWRVRHDMFRLPLFGIVLLICGEFTPLIVVLVDGVVPYTCRLPKQLAAGFAKAEERRQISFRELERHYPRGALTAPRGVVKAHVLRSLHIIGNIWDRINFVPPWLWSIKGELRMAFLNGDDLLLVRDGGVSGLNAEELKIACAERGIDVVGRKEGDMRAALGDWLRLTEAKDPVERRRRMTVLLSTRTEHWPKTRNFELPGWHL